MRTIHNTETDDVIDVPNFVAEKLLKEGKVMLCTSCGMYHTDDFDHPHKVTFYEATLMAMH